MRKSLHEPIADTTDLRLPSDCEIEIVRSFDAPCEVVFDAISRPENVRRWWAPQSRGTMHQCEIDLRVGGSWRFSMHNRAGTEVGFSGTYLELASPAKIVQTEIFDPFPDTVSMVSLTLEAKDGGTKLSNCIRYPSKEIRDQVLASGMELGMRESYQQLAYLIDLLAADTD